MSTLSCRRRVERDFSCARTAVVSVRVSERASESPPPSLACDIASCSRAASAFRLGRDFFHARPCRIRCFSSTLPQSFPRSFFVPFLPSFVFVLFVPSSLRSLFVPFFLFRFLSVPLSLFRSFVRPFLCVTIVSSFLFRSFFVPFSFVFHTFYVPSSKDGRASLRQAGRAGR